MMKGFGKKIHGRLLSHRGIEAKSITPSRVQLPPLLDYPEPLSITHSHPPSVDDSYINRLPVELLQQIFLLIINDIPDYPCIFSVEGTAISANFNSPPLVFTRVCCLWRIIAHSTPDVWSRIQVVLPGRAELKPFLPSLLQAWLARSGSRPLTLRIVSGRLPRLPHFPRLKIRYLSYADSQLAHSQLIKILLSESWRWESTTLMASIYEWSHNFDTPQLRTLRCFLPDLSKFNAPNLSRLCTSVLQVVNTNSQFNCTPTCKYIRHLHFREASTITMQKILAMFPHLETIVVNEIASPYGYPSRGNPVTNSCLESMTLPLQPDGLHAIIDVLDGIHLPKLQKLTVVGRLNQAGVDCIMAVLAVPSCNVQVMDLPIGTAPDVDADMVELWPCCPVP